MQLTKELWGKSACGKEIYLYTLKNESGAYVQLSNIGAGVVAVVVPDKDGNLADVTLGYPDPMSYFGDGPCAGKIPGRYANRVALGKFSLDGKEYELEVLTTLEYNGFSYMAVIPAGESLEEYQMEVSILKSVEEDGESILCAIEDEQELQAVYDLIMEELYAEEEEDEDAAEEEVVSE